MQIDTSAATNGRFIYQDFTVPGECFMFSTYIYRQSGINYFSIQTDWDRGVIGTANVVTSVKYDDSGIQLVAWDVPRDFNFVLSLNVWHQVSIAVDTAQGIQDLFVDGAFLGRVTKLSPPPGGSEGTTIIGDTAGMAQHGKYVYDDVSLQVAPCAVPIVCGDGVVAPGEQCDDGNTLNGDCCSSTCQRPTGCAPAGKSLLLLKNNADDTKDKLVWKWLKGAETDLEDLGVPTGTTNYTLCLYAGTASASVALPAGSKWQTAGSKGYKFKDKSATPNGAQKALLKSGAAGKAKALVKGKGTNLPDALVPMLTLPVTAQLVNDTNNICFEAVYNSDDVKKNDAKQFKAKARQ